jgi:aerotolerance regulator-like protein
MTFLAPGFFVASLAVAAAVAALHFIVTRQPRAGVLPTARFVPDLPATATARATRPSDLLLMLLRVLIVLAVGAGLARPVFRSSRKASARVILADGSLSVTDARALRDSVKRYYRDGDAVVVFDSSARLLSGKISDSVDAQRTSNASGNLSAGLIAAFRAASALRDNADSLELVIVSPFAASEVDRATDSIRSLWPGNARIVKAGASAVAPAPASEPVQLRMTAGDPLSISIARLGSAAAAGSRIVRDMPANDDSSWVETGPRALVDWPVNNRPRGALSRAKIDTIGGVISGSSIVVSAFPRKWFYPADSIHGALVIARWTDGEPAAVEWRRGNGCVRSVSVPVNPVGDLVLSTAFLRFTGAMTRSCTGHAQFIEASQTELSVLAGRGGLAARDAFRPRDDVRSILAPWLLGLALLAAIAELFVRRGKKEIVSSSAAGRDKLGRAA